MKHILIAGGAGYIGTALVNRLMQYEHLKVTVIDNLLFGGHALHSYLASDGERLKLIKADVRDLALMDDLYAVVNLASLNLPMSKQYPNEANAINHLAAVELAEQCANNGIKYVFSSTCSNYGVKTEGYAIETDALYPTSVYAKSKVETEQAIQNMPYDNTVILRFATAYGLAARFRPDLILHEFIKDAWTKKLITLNGPNFYRPLCHVDDIARAIIRALNIARPKSVYNIGNTAHNFTKLQLAEMIQEQLPDCAIAVSPSIPDPRNYKVSFEKARKDLFFETIHNPKDEIAKIVNALKDGLLTFEDQKIAYAIS